MSTPDAPIARCISCGYDLAGLPTDGVCPECGSDTEAAFLLMRFVEMNRLKLSEISTGLAATQIGYAILSIGIALIAGSLMLAPVLAVAFIVFVILGTGASLLTGLAQTSSPIEFPEATRHKYSHSALLGMAAAGFGIGILVVLPSIFILMRPEPLLLMLALMSASMCLTILAHARLSSRIAPYFGQRALGRIEVFSPFCAVTFFALSLLWIGVAYAGQVHNVAFLRPPTQLFALAAAVVLLGFPALHFLLAYRIHRVIRTMLGHSTPPATPAAL